MQRECKNCDCTFMITEDDLDFCDRVSPVFGGKKYPIAPPSLCPDCRMQRRMSWRNERSIYASTCARCKKRMIFMYSPEKQVIAYCHECFWSDASDARECGIEIDFRRHRKGTCACRSQIRMGYVSYPRLSSSIETSENWKQNYRACSWQSRIEARNIARHSEGNRCVRRKVTKIL